MKDMSESRGRLEGTRLDRLQLLILSKTQSLVSETKNPVVDWDDLSWAVAQEYRPKKEVDRVAAEKEEQESGSSWRLPNVVDPRYMQVFHSYKQALRFRSAFYHSLKRLRERGLVRIEKGTKKTRSRKAYIILTQEGEKAIKEKMKKKKISREPVA